MSPGASAPSPLLPEWQLSFLPGPQCRLGRQQWLFLKSLLHSDFPPGTRISVYILDTQTHCRFSSFTESSSVKVWGPAVIVEVDSRSCLVRSQ